MQTDRNREIPTTNSSQRTSDFFFSLLFDINPLFTVTHLYAILSDCGVRHSVQRHYVLFFGCVDFFSRFLVFSNLICVNLINCECEMLWFALTLARYKKHKWNILVNCLVGGFCTMTKFKCKFFSVRSNLFHSFIANLFFCSARTLLVMTVMRLCWWWSCFKTIIHSLILYLAMAVARVALSWYRHPKENRTKPLKILR